MARTIVCCALLLVGVCLTDARPSSGATTPVDDSTWTDHDGQPIPKPPDWGQNFYGQLFHEIFVEPIAHALDVPDKLIGRREASNVNAFDEVPNSTWFTNRNHVRAIPVSELEQGPDSTLLPAKPWTITKRKEGGASAGFRIKDAAGRKWLIKLDWHGYPGLSSGADMVARTLLHAAGYSVPHNEPVRFRREDLVLDEKLARARKGERFTEADLDTVLAKGARTSGGEYIAIASLFLPGHVLGVTSLDRRRPGDRNDWYRHPNRRELRGLYVICSWIGDWDTKDPNFLDSFDSTGAGQGYVKHYILDAGSSFGADADGVKRLEKGYEGTVDFGAIGRRIATLGFTEDRWRSARQETGIPSVGRFESDTFQPRHFTTEVPNPAFRLMTDRDAYWGAKIVASFSDAQIRAAVNAAHYEDPRATGFLVRNLIQRRDTICRYWFGRTAPLDFFTTKDGQLRFHDLAEDRGLVGARKYIVAIAGGGRLRISTPVLPLEELGSSMRQVDLELSVDGSRARPARVELVRKDLDWVVTGVRHGGRPLHGESHGEHAPLPQSAARDLHAPAVHGHDLLHQ